MNDDQKTKALGWGLLAVILGSLLLIWQRPQPGPAPGPFDPAGSFLVLVTDNDQRTAEQAALLLDDGLRAWLAEKKVSFRVIDDGGAAYKDGGYEQLLARDGARPPAVVLVGLAGGLPTHRTGPWPRDAEALKQWVLASPHTGPPFVESGGHRRYLTRLPPSQARFMAPRGGSFREQVSAPIPRAQWKEIDSRAKYPAAEWVYDQDGYGACVGNGSTAALRKIRRLSGMTDVRLAPGCTYAQINGGRDQGAVISDSLTALQQTGTVSAKSLGSDQDPHFTRQLPSGWKNEAKRFRIEEAYHLDTFDDMATAIQLGYLIVYGMQVGNNFEAFSPDGVAGVSRGVGNHCMHADGLKKLPNGRWALDNVNSWGATWGPWKNGRCYLVEEHFAPPCQPDAYAVKTAVEDPLDPIRPPKPKGRVDLENVPVAAAVGDCKPGCPRGCAREGDCKCGSCPYDVATPPPGVRPRVDADGWHTEADGTVWRPVPAVIGRNPPQSPPLYLPPQFSPFPAPACGPRG